MNRGSAKQAIFLDDDDRRRFILLLASVSRRFKVEIHAYCLMDNHYHLVIHSVGGQLSEALKHLSACYTRRFNTKHGRDGSIFRGRFSSCYIDNDSYLIAAARYVHRNPLAFLSECELESYPWSSFGSYAGQNQPPWWLHSQLITAISGGSPAAYRALTLARLSSDQPEKYGAAHLPDHGGTHVRDTRSTVTSLRGRASETPLATEVGVIHAIERIVADVVTAAHRSQTRCDMDHLLTVTLCRDEADIADATLAKHFAIGSQNTLRVSSNRLTELLRASPQALAIYQEASTRVAALLHPQVSDTRTGETPPGVRHPHR